MKAQTAPCDSVIFFENFEGPTGGWNVDNGLWHSHSGQKVAGTILNGGVPGGFYETRLISPSVVLPTITSAEELRIRYWYWLNPSSTSGLVQVSVDSAGTWGPWLVVSRQTHDLNSGWVHSSNELTRFSGRRIRIGFRFNAASNFAGGWGWYVDDVSVIRTNKDHEVSIAWDFEVDARDCWSRQEKWWASNGLWQIGSETTPTAHSDTSIAGTVLRGSVLGGFYTTRLVSPPIHIPLVSGGDNLRFRFSYWLEPSSTSGNVQIASDSGNGRWNPNWETLSQYTLNTGWVRTFVDIPIAYAGKRVELAFAFSAASNFAGGRGWYIDDVDLFDPDSIPSVPVVFSFGKDSIGLSLRPTLRWHLAAGADLYRVQVSTSPTFTSILRDTTLDRTSWKATLPSSSGYYYRVNATNIRGTSNWSGIGTITAIKEAVGSIPEQFILSQNYPNPFNPETRITYQIPNSSHVTLKVFDLLGREVAILVNESLQPGTYQTTFDGSGLASGVYVYRLQTDRFSETRKLVLLR
jgi:hypothetical protein